MVCLCSLLEKTKHKQVQSLISKCVQTHGSQSLFFYGDQNVNRFITVLFRSFIEIIVYKQVCHGCLCSLRSRDWNVNKCTLLCWRNAQLSYNGVVANIISNLSIKYIVHVNARPCISQVLYPEQGTRSCTDMDFMMFNNSSHSAWHSKATSQISTKRWALTCPSSFTTPSWNNWELLTNQRKSKVNSTQYFTLKVQAYLMEFENSLSFRSTLSMSEGRL